MSLKSAMQKVLNTHKRKLSVSHGEAGKQEQLMVLAKSPFNNKKKKVTTNCSKDGGVSSAKTQFNMDIVKGENAHSFWAHQTCPNLCPLEVVAMQQLFGW